MTDNLTQISFTINGKKSVKWVKSSLMLIDFIRDELKLKGTKPGCLEGECGACTVLVNGDAINSCLYPAVKTDGKDVVTIEGLSVPGQPIHPVQQTMLDHGAVQCGFCSCGIALSIKSYGDRCKKEGIKPSRQDVKKSLEGHLCRCTGYIKIIDAAVDYIEKVSV
ncbi:MAG: (2Fe-2S)-binding protein [Bacteroidetes bacterium]|nr:(2Fe-2S)-binding protein [Bacteroidota bacterium]